MNLKKIKIISIIGIIILCFLFHSIYEIIPSTITSIFFPVNESIWEHQKLIFTSTIVFGIIEYILLNKFKIKHNNFFVALLSSAVLSIVIFLIIYLPLYYKIGPKMILNISVMVISIIISQLISLYILNQKDYNKLNKIFMFLIIISYIIFAYLTYKPIKCKLFFDTQDEKYGIDIYNKES